MTSRGTSAASAADASASESSRRTSWRNPLSIRLIRWYQRVISPAFPARCKYYPTCSAYAVTAIRRFGSVRGLFLAFLRLLRCQPWNRGGIDDVPQAFSPFYRFSWSKAHEEPRVTPDAGAASRAAASQDVTARGIAPDDAARRGSTDEKETVR